MTKLLSASTQAWLDAAATFRAIKAGQGGFHSEASWRDFVSRGSQSLTSQLSETSACAEVFREILRLGDLDLLAVSLKTHGRNAWLKAWSSVGAGEPAKTGNLPVLSLLQAEGLSLHASASKILLVGTKKDDPKIIEFWRNAGFRQDPTVRLSLIKVIETCGHTCASAVHQIISECKDTSASFDLKAAFLAAISAGKPKPAVYLRACGVRLADIAATDLSRAVGRAHLSDTLQHRLQALEGSAHANLAFFALEPDPVSILARPRHETFAGISPHELFPHNPKATVRIP